jgi:hypothetical protein
MAFCPSEYQKPHPNASNRDSGVILVRNPADLATMAAFLTGSQEVAGSIPVSSTICFSSFSLIFDRDIELASIPSAL